MQRTLYQVLTVKTQHKPYCGPPAALYVVLRPLICLWTPSRWLPAACTAPVSPSAAGPAPPPSSELYSAPMQDGGRGCRIRRGKGGVKGAKEILYIKKGTLCCVLAQLQHQWHREGPYLLLILQCMLGTLQVVLQVSLLCSLGCLSW